MKKAFLMYTDNAAQIDLLSDAQAGVLLKAIFARERDEELPEMDGMTQMAYSFITAQMDRDREKYEITTEKRRQAGLKGGRKPKQTETNESKVKQTEANESKPKQAETKKPDTDTDTDTDTDIKERNSKERKKQTQANHQMDIEERFGQNPYAPDIQDVKEFIAVKHLAVNPDEFYAHYTGVGWKSGGSPITNWQSLAMAWDAKAKSRQGKRRQQEDSPTGSRFADMFIQEYGGNSNGY